MTSQSGALRELLLGHGPGQLHLSAVRARAEELKRSLDQIIHLLQHAADRMQWTDALDRFAVINVQYQHLQEALRPTLRQFAAYPRSVNQTNAPILPIMLATKLLPEMEAEERELLHQLEAQQQRLGAAGGQVAAQLSIAEQFAWVQDQEQELNYCINLLTREENSALGEKRRKEVQQAAAKTAAAAGPGPRQQRQAAQHKGGDAPDPLLAAVAYGAGLSI